MVTRMWKERWYCDSGEIWVFASKDGGKMNGSLTKFEILIDVGLHQRTRSLSHSRIEYELFCHVSPLVSLRQAHP